jgi:hypothetical protein
MTSYIVPDPTRESLVSDIPGWGREYRKPFFTVMGLVPHIIYKVEKPPLFQKIIVFPNPGQWHILNISLYSYEKSRRQFRHDIQQQQMKQTTVQ